MDLQSRKIIFVQEFLRLQNEGIIEGLENLLKKQKSELYEKKNIKSMSLKQFNDEIDQSIEDSKNDNIIESSQLKSEVLKWR